MAAPGELSIGVLAALLTGLPGRAGRRPRARGRRRGGAPPREPVSYTLPGRPLAAAGAGPRGTLQSARPHPCPRAMPAASLIARRAAPPVAARRLSCSRSAPGLRRWAGPPPRSPRHHMRRHLDDVAALRRLDHLPAAEVDRHVDDAARVGRVLPQKTRSPGCRSCVGHLRQRGVLRPAVARDGDAGPGVGVLGQAAAVEADDARSGARPGPGPRAPPPPQAYGGPR